MGNDVSSCPVSTLHSDLTLGNYPSHIQPICYQQSKSDSRVKSRTLCGCLRIDTVTRHGLPDKSCCVVIRKGQSFFTLNLKQGECKLRSLWGPMARQHRRKKGQSQKERLESGERSGTPKVTPEASKYTNQCIPFLLKLVFFKFQLGLLAVCG